MKRRFITFSLISGLAAMTAAAQSSGGGVGGAPVAGRPAPAATPGGSVTSPNTVRTIVLPPVVIPQPGNAAAIPNQPINQTLPPPTIGGQNNFAGLTNRFGIATNRFVQRVQLRGGANELSPGSQRAAIATNQFSPSGITNQIAFVQPRFGTNEFGIVTNAFVPVIVMTNQFVTIQIVGSQIIPNPIISNQIIPNVIIPNVIVPNEIVPNQLLFPTGRTNLNVPIQANLPNQADLPPQPPAGGNTPPLPTSPGGP